MSDIYFQILAENFFLATKISSNNLQNPFTVGFIVNCSGLELAMSNKLDFFLLKGFMNIRF